MDQVLKTRTITGVIFGLIVLGLISIGKYGVFVLFTIIMFGSLAEYLRITQVSKVKQIVSYTIAFFILLIFFSLNTNVDIKLVILGITLGVYVFLCGSIFFTQQINHQKLLPVLIIFYPVLSLMFPLLFKDSEFNKSIFWLSVILLIWASDSFAYLVGRKLGKHKLFERLSPKKTWEGFLGGGFFTLLFSFIIGKYFSNLPLVFWLRCGLIIWVFGTIGDLFESSIKRMYDVKDSGKILPGHGGFLDRFDSLIFIIPFILFLLYKQNLLL
jgi:phosphatidate cytidylyltransferase